MTKQGVTAAWIGFVCLLACAATAAADNQTQARDEYNRGKALFESGDFQGARTAFEQAQALQPSAILHFNIGLCHERLGDKKAALDSYRRYLSEKPAAENRATVEAKIKELESALGDGLLPLEPAPAEPPPNGYRATGDPELDRIAKIPVEPESPVAAALPALPPAAEPGPPAPASPPPDVPPPAKADPFYKKWWFWVIAGVGTIIIIDVAVSSSKDDDPNRMFESQAVQGPALFRF